MNLRARFTVIASVRNDLMMNVGELLKKMRELRKVSQRQLCAGISSQAALSRMEKSGNIPANMLLAFLDRLDIQPIEFFALAEEHQTANTRVFLDRLQEAKSSRQKANQLIKEETGLYQKTGILRHKINALVVSACYCKANKIPLKNNDVIAVMVKDYLLKLGNWFINDALLYVNVFFIFDNAFIKSNHLQVIRLLEQSPFDSAQKYTYQIDYANNVILLAFERKNLLDLAFYLANYQELLTNDFSSLSARICYSIFEQLYELMCDFSDKRYQNLLQELQNLKTNEAAGIVTKLTDFVNDCLKDQVGN